MNRYKLAVILILIVCAAQVAAAQSTPVVTIDTNKNFCINGVPTFLIGTIGGDTTAWQNYLTPAGFNIRILSNMSTTGAQWEIPDVLSSPSSVSPLKNNPGVLMWTLGYQVDSILRDQLNWPGSTPIDIVNKMQQVKALDAVPNRPVGVIWGNDTMLYGYEFGGRDGYWQSTRLFEQLTDFFVSGDQNVVEEQTISNSVRLSLKPVIAMTKCVAASDQVAYRPSPEEITVDLWTAAVTGAKGIIIDRYESQDANGNSYDWTHSIDQIYWDTIKKCTSEISQLNSVWTSPGPWMYYKAKPNEENWPLLLYTHRMVGSDMYLVMVNNWHMTPITRAMMAPIIQSTARGEVLFDNLTKGVLSHPATSTTITDASKTWTTNQFAGDRLWIKHGSPSHEHKYTILSNTSNTITIESGDLLADGAQKWDYYYVNEMVGRSFNCYLPLGGRKVIKYDNVTTYVTVPKPAEAVGKPSARRWVELMDWSGYHSDQRWPADGYGLAYDQNRHKLVCFGGVENLWPNGKPAPTEPDAWGTPCIYEWDLNSSSYSGRLYDGQPTVGDGWAAGTYYSDFVYNPARQSCMAYNEDGSMWEWRGMDLGWRKTPTPTTGDYPGMKTLYAACYDPVNVRYMIYGGRSGNYPGMQYRTCQYTGAWVNQLYSFNGTSWYYWGNADVNIPYTPLEEPQMVWDTNRQIAVLFGCSHDGVRTKDVDPVKFYQDVPQQTWEIGSTTQSNMRNTSHVPYVFANYRMVFDPRTASTLLFGGLPSKNGRITDLYEYNGTDWSRLDYDSSSLPAQDVRRTPSLVYDPDHQMVLFLDTRTKKIWGLTSGTETTVTSIDAARALSPNASLVLEGMYVSRVFDGCFYIQDSARTTGIKVVSSTVPEIGTRVNVIGTLMQNASGEKYLQAKVVGQTGSGTVEPLAMANSALTGKAAGSRPGADGALGVNNTGILVRVWGSVSYIGSGYIYIDDGTGLLDGSGHTGVKVQLNGVGAPSLGAHIAVTGISATERVGTTNARVVLLSRAEDMTSY